MHPKPDIARDPSADARAPKVLLVTPPLLQPNTPYAAMPAIAGFLKAQGVDVVQADLSLELVLELFSEEGIDLAVRAVRRMRRPSPEASFLLDNEDAYRRWIGPAVAFLQGHRPELAWRLARPGELPEGPHFRELAPEEGDDAVTPGADGIADRARMAASLFLDDVADLLRALVDPDFGFSRYAEHLAVAAPVFDPFLRRLRSRRPTEIDRRIDRLAREAVEREQPDYVGVTAPFPGTVYAAFRIAQVAKAAVPGVITVLGGGYVNSELRDMDDPRVFDFFDRVCFDEGYAPWLGVLGLGPEVRTRSRLTPGATRRPSKAIGSSRQPSMADVDDVCGALVVPDYSGLDLSRYVSLVETANPMSRLWSDGRWLKLQLANGCYWHRCAFCDIALDYIGGYRPADPARVVDAIQAMRRQTGLTGFHFTDEAIPPALARGVADELLRRGETVSWWGNVRLDRAFDAALAARMAEAGCIAVTAGLECANDRLLKLMNKGITLASARRACRAFTDAGILVHVYLMYGFPTETEAETLGALETVRDLFAEGLVQSAFWHRFALTVHSPIARDPARFGIEPLPPPPAPPGRRFALNEIPYREKDAPDLDRLGRGLSLATYNYMRGQGLDLPVEFWFREETHNPP